MKNYYDGNDKLNFNEANFRFAFTFVGKEDLKRKDDPRYVKILARLWTQKDGIKSEKILDYHLCTAEDLK